MTQADYRTEQEAFWAGEFGTDYIQRNRGSKLLASNLSFFSKALAPAGRIESCIEFGANIGINLAALKLLFPELRPYGIEINQAAARELAKLIGSENVYIGSILDYPVTRTFELVLIKGVLIHVNPDALNSVYDKLYESCARYILLCEYYSPSPATIPYRGHADRLFKRDFCGDMLTLFSDLRLIDYGFVYRRDPAFPQDDITWFLMRKGS